MGLESLERPPQNRHLEVDHSPVFHASGREVRCVRHVGGRQSAFFDELVQADQQRVAGKGRERLIGRITVAGWPQGQHLPQALPAGVEKIHKPIGRLPQFANAEGTGKGCRVEKNATGSGECHVVDSAGTGGRTMVERSSPLERCTSRYSTRI